MPNRPDITPTPALRPRVALLSIVGFWLFYYAIITVRSTVMGHGDQVSMLGRRAMVTLACMAVTGLIYLVLRRIPTGSLRRAIVTAAVLAIPAAIAYSVINGYAFSMVSKALPPPPPPHATSSSSHSPNAAPSNMMVQVGGAWPEDEKLSPVKEIADNAANAYFFFAAWSALYLALCYAAEIGVLERRSAALRAAAQAAELRALRYQVNPHFLYNTLNSLSSLVMAGRRETAEKMIINLSNFFRTSLSDAPTDDVPLSEEIRLQHLYLGIEQIRFPERLVVDIDIPDALADACVPGLILQPLVENAVKYGVSQTLRPVTIRIRAQEEAGVLVLTVQDDGDPEPVGQARDGRTGVGLRNVGDRLIARFGEAATCRWEPGSVGGFTVTLTMPLVRDGC